ncbi:TIGR04076 family protein [Adlercreutzia shanghongiae]|uniref:TIGR04076 family protein n=1 Tax=Adlercreutzia shanghongiae TaxID=3111773 RepID=A0ABU6IVT6_9ACTN|nr:TIGR04076 family protein [Adlercreutzia sp. R22]MEC4293939.1 TIGR04076 family protein [Adlercreutzia sp. R22]
MKYECKVTVLETKVFPELQARFLADPQSGPCPCFEAGQEYVFRREPGADDFWKFGRDLNPAFPCAEAWDCISRYIYSALQGGSIMHGWTNDERMMIACCNDGTRPVVFKVERIDIPESEDEAEWLAVQDFANTAEDAYTGAE